MTVLRYCNLTLPPPPSLLFLWAVDFVTFLPREGDGTGRSFWVPTRCTHDSFFSAWVSEWIDIITEFSIIALSLFLSYTSRLSLSLIHLIFFLSLSMAKTASALTGSNITHFTGYKIFIYQMEKLGEYLSEDEMAFFPFKFTFPLWVGLCIIRLHSSSTATKDSFSLKECCVIDS